MSRNKAMRSVTDMKRALMKKKYRIYKVCARKLVSADGAKITTTE